MCLLTMSNKFFVMGALVVSCLLSGTAFASDSYDGLKNATIAPHFAGGQNNLITNQKLLETILAGLTFKGTSGIRGNADLLEEIAPYLALAVAEVAQEQGVEEIMLGYDTRESSSRIASQVARILSGRGIKVESLQKPIPSPMLSYSIARKNDRAVNKNLVAGVMITGSHNP
ncbi:hypothetical protein ACFL3D_00520, partial [Candidatus Omnitrophota bacterium]